jgi:hypothetical protein
MKKKVKRNMDESVHLNHPAQAGVYRCAVGCIQGREITVHMSEYGETLEL